MYVGLCSFFVEAAKHALNEHSFVKALQDATGVVDSSRIARLASTFTENLPAFRSRLDELGVPAEPAIVNDAVALVRCRLTSTEVERLAESECLVKLTTSADDDDVQFACSLLQLEDLVWTLRHATQVVEQHAQ